MFYVAFRGQNIWNNLIIYCKKEKRGEKNLLKKKIKKISVTCRLQLVNWEYLPLLDVQPQQIYLHASPGSV